MHLDGSCYCGAVTFSVEAYAPDGALLARVPSPQLAPPWPPNIGIARPALNHVLGEAARARGAEIRLGVTAEEIDDEGDSAMVERIEHIDQDDSATIQRDEIEASSSE